MNSPSRKEKILGTITETTENLNLEVTSRWRIDDFELNQMVMHEVWKSPVFQAGDRGEFKFRFYLKQCSADMLCLGAETLECDVTLHKFKYKLFTTSDEKEKKFLDTLYSPRDKEGSATAVIPYDSIKRFGLIKNRTLITGVDISIEFAYLKNQLVADISNLLNNDELADVTLVCQGQEKKAHKVILAARSPVFSAMFIHDMQETRNNSVYIEEINHEVFEELIRFIYTGKVQNLAEVVEELLIAAEMYGIQTLKDTCENHLVEKLESNNASELLNFANQYMCEKLKEEALKVVVSQTGTEIQSLSFG